MTKFKPKFVDFFVNDMMKDLAKAKKREAKKEIETLVPWDEGNEDTTPRVCYPTREELMDKVNEVIDRINQEK